MERGSAVFKVLTMTPAVLEISLHSGNSGSLERKLHIGSHRADKEELLIGDLVTFPMQTILVFVHVLDSKPRALRLLMYH